MESVIQEGLEMVLRKINRDIAIIEVRLQKLANKVGLNDWRELEKLFTEKGVDNPEVDMLWPEFLYLKNRLEELRSRKEKVLTMLKGSER